MCNYNLRFWVNFPEYFHGIQKKGNMTYAVFHLSWKLELGMMLHGVEQYKQTRVAIVSSICSLKLTANRFAHTYITADAHWTALCMTEL